jgi:hypothetical protein
MSIAVMSRVWEESKFRGSNLLCLLALADWSNDDGWSWYGIDRLSGKVRLERRQTINVIENLEETHELFVHRNLGPHGTNLYWVAIGVQSFTPPPEILGLEIVRPPTYRGSTAVRGAILRRGIAPNTLLNITEEESDSSPLTDRVQGSAPLHRKRSLRELIQERKRGEKG